jgi:hypothetical protein
MGCAQGENHAISRRTLLKAMGLAPVLFTVAPLHGWFRSELASGDQGSRLQLADFRLTPHYPAKSPLEDVLCLVAPGRDEYVTEKYAAEIMPLLGAWAEGLKARPPALDHLARFLETAVEAAALSPVQELSVRKGGVEVFRRIFPIQSIAGRENC